MPAPTPEQMAAAIATNNARTGRVTPYGGANGTPDQSELLVAAPFSSSPFPNAPAPSPSAPAGAVPAAPSVPPSVPPPATVAQTPPQIGIPVATGGPGASRMQMAQNGAMISTPEPVGSATMTPPMSPAPGVQLPQIIQGGGAGQDGMSAVSQGKLMQDYRAKMGLSNLPADQELGNKLFLQSSDLANKQQQQQLDVARQQLEQGKLNLATQNAQYGKTIPGALMAAAATHPELLTDQFARDKFITAMQAAGFSDGLPSGLPPGVSGAPRIPGVGGPVPGAAAGGGGAPDPLSKPKPPPSTNAFSRLAAIGGNSAQLATDLSNEAKGGIKTKNADETEILMNRIHDVMGAQDYVNNPEVVKAITQHMGGDVSALQNKINVIDNPLAHNMWRGAKMIFNPSMGKANIDESGTGHPINASSINNDETGNTMAQIHRRGAHRFILGAHGYQVRP